MKGNGSDSPSGTVGVATEAFHAKVIDRSVHRCPAATDMEKVTSALDERESLRTIVSEPNRQLRLLVDRVRHAPLTRPVRLAGHSPASRPPAQGRVGRDMTCSGTGRDEMKQRGERCRRGQHEKRLPVHKELRQGAPRPVSRVLSEQMHFGRSFLSECGRPHSLAAYPRCLDRGGRLSPHIWPCSSWGLPCRTCCHERGGLLPHRFTLTHAFARAVCFLWHCPSPNQRCPGVTWQPVHWSPDFPRSRNPASASRPSGRGTPRRNVAHAGSKRFSMR